ncbi:hypothetical protein [Candidatus Vallotia tarda]|uniref:hypothetical protein n=1 Tax=Candidatus Vallotiella hemipterorum TaxID=1177213 RepID=UPI001FE8DD23|nr:hypothetical protein [Candidatus Vallotia tarda]
MLDHDLYLALKKARIRLGLDVSVNDCSPMLLGLPSIEARYRAHAHTALSLASWLKCCLEVSLVFASSNSMTVRGPRILEARFYECRRAVFSGIRPSLSL